MFPPIVIPPYATFVALEFRVIAPLAESKLVLFRLMSPNPEVFAYVAPVVPLIVIPPPLAAVD